MPKQAERIKVPLNRYGGKINLAKWIVSHFPEHTTYIEPFCGSGAVFFQKEPAQAEILNDRDDRIINAFEQIRSRPFELAAMIWATPYAQRNWREMTTKSDLERAALEIAAAKQFYAGATHNSTFSIDVGHANKNKARVWGDWFLRVLPAAVRLKDAQILCQDALEVIARFADRDDALYYVDAPYLGHEREYGYSVCFRSLSDALHAVKGKVVLSGGEKEAAFFPTWRKETRSTVGRARTGHGMVSKKYQECLYTNFGGLNGR